MSSIGLYSHLPDRLEQVTDAQRLFHGRGRTVPGLEHLVVDYYPPALVVTHFGPGALSTEELALRQGELTQWSREVLGGSDTSVPIIFQERGVRPARSQLLVGDRDDLPDPHWVTEAGLQFRVDLFRGQNHGLFLDMAEGRRWLRDRSAGRQSVLNLFAYTCSLSVAAMAGGAEYVVNLDMAGGALTTGKRNHAQNGFDRDVSYLPHNLFKTFGKLRKAGPFDIIVVDPPSHQPGSFVAAKDYPKVIRKLPELLNADGEIAEALLCLNAPELGTDFLLGMVAEHAPELEFVRRLPNPKTFPDADPEAGLKALLFRAS